MNKYMKLLSLLTVIVLLVGFDIPNNEAIIEEDRIGFGEEYKIQELSSNDKEDMYQSLDVIQKIETEMPGITEYAQIEPFDDYESFIQLMENSKEEPQVVYFGYDACPFCKAFTPKISQLAKEFDVTINHYNTDENMGSEDFLKIVAPFSLQTVPHAFLIEDEQVIDILNDKSTMEEIETFITAAQPNS
ncbi:thioredoxin family protein [Aerococcaceae bacterium DSM 111176]|nr:thioredoxin family protein [Aerococcaceae bacterium DSM 111176]